MRSTCGSKAETKRQFSGNILDMLPENEYENQGMYKNRVKNNKKMFEIPALFLENKEIQHKTE